MTEYRSGLPERPARIKALPLDSRGYPIPFFVAVIDGVPDFRVIGPGRVQHCWNKQRCWICGQPLGRYVSFTVGPMCAVNRISSEPPSHRECSEYAARACPFLTIPSASRRDANLPEEAQDPAGIGLKRNPGMALVWVADTHGPNPPRPWRVENGVLFKLGDPKELHWFTQGRKATPQEVEDALEIGYPAIRSVAEQEGPASLAEFERQLEASRKTIAAWSVW